MIEINNLTKIYTTSDKQSVLALDNVSLSVQRGEIFGIIGLSGAGKSTLIRCINHLESPTSGSITVDGREITALSRKNLRSARQQIGMIFQHFNLLSSRTVMQNVLFPLEIADMPTTEANKKARDLLDLVGLTDKSDVYPAQLSGGQKQRVGIARALANDPHVLLSDEATSALDPQTTRSILRLLKDINRQLNLTILLITHDMNVIKQVCDRVAVIDESRIVEIGDVLHIFSNPASETARSFVNSVMESDVPEDILATTNMEKLEGQVLVRVSFIGKSASQPIISSMMRRFDLNANIISANIDRIKDTPYGHMVIEFTGSPGIIKEAITYLADQGLEIEVLHHDRNTEL